MEVTFTPYALQQLRERELTETETKDAVEQADQILEGEKGRMVAQKRIKKIEQEYLLGMRSMQTAL